MQLSTSYCFIAMWRARRANTTPAGVGEHIDEILDAERDVCFEPEVLHCLAPALLLRAVATQPGGSPDKVALLVLSVMIDFTAHNYRSYTHLILALGIAREPTVWIQDPPGIGVVRIGGRGTTQNIIAL